MRETLYNQIIQDHYPRVFRLCYRYFGNGDDAEDATQEVFLKVWLNKDKFRGESNIGTWIYRITVNVCLTFFRNRQIKEKGTEYLSQYYYPDGDILGYSEGESGYEKIQFLEKFLCGCPAIDRTLINLYLENMDSRHIAEITGLSESNTRIRIHRIKKRILSEWEVYHEK